MRDPSHSRQMQLRAVDDVAVLHYCYCWSEHQSTSFRMATMNRRCARAYRQGAGNMLELQTITMNMFWMSNHQKSVSRQCLHVSAFLIGLSLCQQFALSWHQRRQAVLRSLLKAFVMLFSLTCICLINGMNNTTLRVVRRYSVRLCQRFDPS